MILTSFPHIVSHTFIFRGQQNSPLLAPRGIWLVNGKLIVSDTGQNRVFIWNVLPQTEFQPPDIILGQDKVTGTARNAGTSVSASTLQYPSGVWSDGNRLVVADAWNHRVLIWHSFPTYSGQPADVVVGQPDFTSNEPNVVGLAHTPDKHSLYWCYGVFSDGERLWIADTGNRRVLLFNTIPTQSYIGADAVIGQPSFTERDYDSNNAVWPYSVKLSGNGALAITDVQYYRVLLWRCWQTALCKPAEVIIGQPSFEANGHNQFYLQPDRHTLSWCYDTLFWKDGFWIADTGNSRLLWFEEFPAQHGVPADAVLGKPTFQMGSENVETVSGTESMLYWPFALGTDAEHPDILAVADTGNHRVMLIKLRADAWA